MFHQLVNVVEHAVGCERDVAVCRNHHFYLHASLYSLSKGLLQLVVEGEIWVDKLYAVLGIVDGIGVEGSYNLVRRTRFTIDNANGLMASCAASVGLKAFEVIPAMYATKVFCAMYVLSCRLVPDSEEYGLQCVDFVAINTAVHISPFAYLLSAVYVVVGHIHSARIGNLSVDYHYFAVVTVEHVVDPWEAYRVEFEYLNTARAYVLEVAFEQRLVVGVVAESVEQCAHFNSFLCLLGEDVEQERCY